MRYLNPVVKIIWFYMYIIVISKSTKIRLFDSRKYIHKGIHTSLFSSLIYVNNAKFSSSCRIKRSTILSTLLSPTYIYNHPIKSAHFSACSLRLPSSLCFFSSSFRSKSISTRCCPVIVKHSEI